MALTTNMLLMGSLGSLLFLGGWYAPVAILAFLPSSFWFGLKVSGFVILFIVARGILPRYRYDQLMRLGWKIFLPFTLSWLLFTVSVLLSFNWL